jgi:Fe-S-cluster containining protein
MIEQLPCASCTALCCGVVQITEARLNKIREHLAGISSSERKRLARQFRGELDCRFVDKETHRCTIYPVRPWVCEAFGRTEGLVCPKVGKLVQILPTTIVDVKAREEMDTPIVGISSCWDWRKMEFDPHGM